MTISIERRDHDKFLVRNANEGFFVHACLELLQQSSSENVCYIN